MASIYLSNNGLKKFVWLDDIIPDVQSNQFYVGLIEKESSATFIPVFHGCLSRRKKAGWLWWHCGQL
jgi:hypothetical protein